MTDNTIIPRNLIPLTKWTAAEGYPPPGTLRHLVANAKTNGFDKVIVRCGRRILIIREAFYVWLHENGGRNE